LYLGPRDRGHFTGAANANFTQATVYVPIPVRFNVRLGIICRDEVQSLDAISQYYAISAAAQFEGIFHHKDDAITFECGIMDLDDLTVPPAIMESRPYEERGLLYSMDGGFNIVVNLLYDNHKKDMKLVRATKLDENLYDGEGNLVLLNNVTVESVGKFAESEQ
jgi:hypothetical protein